MRLHQIVLLSVLCFGLLAFCGGGKPAAEGEHTHEGESATHTHETEEAGQAEQEAESAGTQSEGGTQRRHKNSHGK